MGEIVFILGGARSGKSSYAVELAKGIDEKVAFIATCLPLDAEMKQRVGIHKKQRPSHWRTFEETENIPALLEKIGSKFNIVVIDCLTLLLSDFLLKNFDEEDIENRINEMLRTLKQAKCKSIIVSNEVGLSIVPKNRMARKFRDLAGRINQKVAQKADKVLFMVSGLPLKIKGG